MSADGLRVRHLPYATPIISGDDNDELSFYFGGVCLEVDCLDGSFIISAEPAGHKQFYRRMQIVTTGFIDGKGKYTFSERSKWAKEKESKDSCRPFEKEEDYDDYLYFKNEIEYSLRQTKVRIYVG